MRPGHKPVASNRSHNCTVCGGVLELQGEPPYYLFHRECGLDEGLKDKMGRAGTYCDVCGCFHLVGKDCPACTAYEALTYLIRDLKALQEACEKLESETTRERVLRLMDDT